MTDSAASGAEFERLLSRQRITPVLGAMVVEAAFAGAQPLSKNEYKYKLSLTKASVRRTVLAVTAHRVSQVRSPQYRP